MNYARDLGGGWPQIISSPLPYTANAVITACGKGASLTLPPCTHDNNFAHMHWTQWAPLAVSEASHVEAAYSAIFMRVSRMQDLGWTMDP